MNKLHVIATCVVVCLIIIFKLPIDVGGLL
jgi:hypothetical protein